MKLPMIVSAFVALCAVAGASPQLAHAQAPLRKITFLTNYTFHGRHSPFFVGLDKGYYRDAGFDVDIQPATGSGFVITAVDSGKADYGMAEAGPVVQAVAKGAKVESFMVFTDISTSGLASLKPYKTLESLEGQRIAASQTDSARVILPILLAKANIDPSSIHWLAADPGVYSSLLLSGQTDLFTASLDGDVPALEKIAKPRGKTVYFAPFADWGYDVFGYFLIAKDTTLASDPGAAKRFAEATRRAVEYAVAHPEETARIMVKHNPALNYDTTLAQWRQAIKSIETPYVKQHGYGVATDERLQRTIDLIKTAMKLDTSMTPKDIYAPVLPAK